MSTSLMFAVSIDLPRYLDAPPIVVDRAELSDAIAELMRLTGVSRQCISVMPLGVGRES